MPSMVTEDTNIGSIETGIIARREILTINGKTKADTTGTTRQQQRWLPQIKVENSRKGSYDNKSDNKTIYNIKTIYTRRTK